MGKSLRELRQSNGTNNEQYKKLQKTYKKMINQEKYKFVNKKLENSLNKSEGMWKMYNTITDKKNPN